MIDEYWVGHSGKWIIPGTEDLRPYISSADKKKKWAAGTLGFAVIAAVAAGVFYYFLMDEVRALFTSMEKRFPGGSLVR